jgi:uncharacterized protein (TIRG00374 family)
MQMKSTLKYLVGLLLAGGLLWWVFKDIPMDDLWRQIQNASISGLALCAVLNIAQNIFRVWRWQALLMPIRREIPFRSMFVAIMVGYMTSWVMPGRLGELVRPLILTSQHDVPLGPNIGSVVADRLLDAMTVVILFAISLWVVPLSGDMAELPSLIKIGSLIVAICVPLAFAGMLLASAWTTQLTRWLDGKPALVRWVGHTALSLCSGVSALRSPRLLFVCCVHSVLIWLTISLATWSAVLAVGADLGFGEILIIMPLIVIGVAMPIPGATGSYHAAMRFGLTLFGIDAVLAGSAAVLTHLMMTVPVILLGFLLVWSEGISWNKLIAGARQIRHLGAAGQQPAMEKIS